MTTVKLNISEKVLDKVLWMLGHFSKDEVEIIHEEDANFLANKQKVNAELERMAKGQATYYTLEEFDSQVREALSKYGDKTER